VGQLSRIFFFVFRRNPTALPALASVSAEMEEIRQGLKPETAVKALIWFICIDANDFWPARAKSAFRFSLSRPHLSHYQRQ